MNILEVVSFDKLPGTTSALVAPYADKLSLRGSRLKGTRQKVWTLRNGNGGDTNMHLDRVGPDPALPGWLTCFASGYYPGGSTDITHEHALLLADQPTAVQTAQTWIALGIRMRWLMLGPNNLTTAGIMIQALLDDSSQVPLVIFSDWESIIVGRTHYFEVSVNRATGSVDVYRDNGKIKSVSIPVGRKLAGFTYGMVGITGGGSYSDRGSQFAIRDIYMAEFTAQDSLKRLGPKVVRPLPASSVNASWPVAVAGKTQVGSLSDVQADGWLNDATPTTVTVDETAGTIGFDATAILPTDRVTAVVITCDATGVDGSRSLSGELFNGATSEQTVSKSFPQTFNYLLGEASGLNSKLFTKQFTTPGNKAAVAALNLKLKAASA